MHHFASRYERTSFSVVVEDEQLNENNSVFTISGGKADKSSPLTHPVIRADIRALGRLLLGYHTSELEEPLRTLFPEKEPGMHYMLE